MEWIVKIEETPNVENEKNQRIRIVFNPITEKVYFYCEVKVKNNKWEVFSEDNYSMEITLILLFLFSYFVFVS